MVRKTAKSSLYVHVLDGAAKLFKVPRRLVRIRAIKIGWMIVVEASIFSWCGSERPSAALLAFGGGSESRAVFCSH